MQHQAHQVLWLHYSFPGSDGDLFNALLHANGFYFDEGVSHRVNVKIKHTIDYADNDFWQRPNLPFVSKPSQLIVEFILIRHSEGEFYSSKSEGAEAAPNHSNKLIVTSMFGRSHQSLLNNNFQMVVKLIPILTSEGAQVPSSKLIVGCGNSEISFQFCKDAEYFVRE